MTRPLLAEDLHHVLTRCDALWPRLSGAHLFITGATGFFGKWLLECLLHANEQRRLGIRITCLSRNPEAFRKAMPHLAHHPALSWHRGDVLDFTFPQGKFTHIVHAATEASAALNRDAPLAMFDTIVTGTRRVLDFAVATGVKDILLTSSGAIYGRQPPELSHIPETFTGGPDPCTPESAYAEGKRAAEQLCVLYARQHGLAPRIARCFAFIGPHLPLDAHFAAGNFLRDAYQGKEIAVQSDGRSLRSYMHAADLVLWLWTILLCGRPGRVYNVGSDAPVSIADLAHLVASHAPTRPAVRILGTPGEAIPERYVPDVSRARSELGLDIHIALPEAVARTLHWLSHGRH